MHFAIINNPFIAYSAGFERWLTKRPYTIRLARDSAYVEELQCMGVPRRRLRRESRKMLRRDLQRWIFEVRLTTASLTDRQKRRFICHGNGHGCWRSRPILESDIFAVAISKRWYGNTGDDFSN